MDALQPPTWNLYAIAFLDAGCFSYRDLGPANVGQRPGFFKTNTQAVHCKLI